MITVSESLLQDLQNRTYTAMVRIETTGGTVLQLDGTRLVAGSLAFERAISSGTSFDIGALIVGKLSVSLDTRVRSYDGIAFEDAELSLFIRCADGSNGVRVGTYTIVSATRYGYIISITAYDMGYKLQHTLTELGVTLPSRADVLVRSICTAAGVTCGSIPSSLSSITIPAIEGTDVSGLQAVAWCAMLAGKSCYMSRGGVLTFTWYDTDALSGTWDSIEADGWDDADFSRIYDVGLDNISSITADAEDITITGVNLTYSGEDGDTTLTSGSAGYVIDISGNLFVTADNAQAVLGNLSAALIGMRFRPFRAAILTMPILEPCDIVHLVSQMGTHVLSVITEMQYTMGAYMSISCGAEAKVRQAAASSSPVVRVIQTVRAIARRARTIAAATAQHFWVTETGTDTGAHITEVTQEEFLADPDNGGGNLLARSNGIAMRRGLRELATVSADGLQVYSDTAQHRKIAHIGYGDAADSGGTTQAPYITLGDRSGTIGAYSLASGRVNVASGPNSTALGMNSHAVGMNSLAAGYGCYANGNNSVAVGEETVASGDGSAAVGSSTASGDYALAAGLATADQNCMTALGKHNATGNSGVLLAVGNGQSSQARNDAFRLYDDGNMLLDIDTTAAAGTTDGDLYAAITALGWESEVIV